MSFFKLILFSSFILATTAEMFSIDDLKNWSNVYYEYDTATRSYSVRSISDKGKSALGETGKLIVHLMTTRRYSDYTGNPEVQQLKDYVDNWSIDKDMKYVIISCPNELDIIRLVLPFLKAITMNSRSMEFIGEGIFHDVNCISQNNENVVKFHDERLMEILKKIERKNIELPLQSPPQPNGPMVIDVYIPYVNDKSKSKSFKIEIQEENGEYHQSNLQSKLLAYTDYIPLWSTSIHIVIMEQQRLNRIKKGANNILKIWFEKHKQHFESIGRAVIAVGCKGIGPKELHLLAGALHALRRNDAAASIFVSGTTFYHTDYRCGDKLIPAIEDERITELLNEAENLPPTQIQSRKMNVQIQEFELLHELKLTGMKKIRDYPIRSINGVYDSETAIPFDPEIGRKVVLIVVTPAQAAIITDPNGSVMKSLWRLVDEFERSSRKRTRSPDGKDVLECYGVLFMECENMKGNEHLIPEIIKKQNGPGISVLRVGLFKKFEKLIKNDAAIGIINDKSIEDFFENNQLNEK